MTPIAQEYLREVLHYDPATGIFRWRERPDRSRSWNIKHAGRVAGWCTSGSGRGYVCIAIDSVKYYAHTLAWIYMTGEQVPKGMEVDHRNRQRAENWWGNLRLATKTQNAHNTGKRSTNTSGFKGVSWDKERQKWLASIMVNHRSMSLGRFDRIEDAIAARKTAEAREHGEFAAAPVITFPGFPASWRCHVVRNCTAVDRKAA